MADATELTEAREILGQVLEDRGEFFELVLIGGGSLLLSGVLDRPTKDLDVVALIEAGEWQVAEPMPSSLAEAVTEVAAALDLAADWVNPGPTSLLEFGLPAGCEARVTRRSFGGLTVNLIDRIDQIALKLYAAADHWPDRSKHLRDLEKLLPSDSELASAASWCVSHDPSPGFRIHQLHPGRCGDRRQQGGRKHDSVSSHQDG